MTTYTQKNIKFWENNFNERAMDNNEGDMSGRKKLELSQYAYMFYDINKSLKLQDNDCVADIGCGGAL